MAKVQDKRVVNLSSDDHL